MRPQIHLRGLWGYDMYMHPMAEGAAYASARLIAKDVLKIPVETLIEFLDDRTDIKPTKGKVGARWTRTYSVQIVEREWQRYQEAIRQEEHDAYAAYVEERKHYAGKAFREGGYQLVRIVCQRHNLRQPDRFQDYIDWCQETNQPKHWLFVRGRAYVDPEIFLIKYKVYRIHRRS